MGKKIRNFNLNEIKDPSFLRTLNYKELKVLADSIRKEIINVTSVNGGHLSSNLGVTDLVISLHRNFDFTKDKLLFDVGHQCYAHKILTGRNLSNLRKKDGVSGFIKSSESPYDIFEAGHSSTSLSAALGYAIDRDNKKEKNEVVALIGDASIANGVAFEALNEIPSSHHKVIVVLNDNAMAISKPVGGMSNFFRIFQTSPSYERFKDRFKRVFRVIKPIYNLAKKTKDFIKHLLITNNLFDSLGFIYIGVVDGHDYKALDKAFTKAKKINKSVIIHVQTKKGKGYKYAEEDKDGIWHGVTPFNIETGESLTKESNQISWSKVYANMVMDKLKNDPKFYLIGCGTLVGSSLGDALKLYPNKVIDTGISEEHAFILAATLAKLNYHVCVSIYSTFMQRAFDEINHDVARIHSPITVLVDRYGLTGDNGETHQGIYDDSFLLSTPNINVITPCNVNEAYTAFNNSFNNKEATFIHYPSGLINNVNDNKSNTLNGFNVLKQGSNNLCVVGVGPLINDLCLECNDLDISIIASIILKPVSNELINTLTKYQKILIYTPYETSNGFADSLLHELSKVNYKGDVIIKAVPLKFISHATISEQLEECQLLPRQIKDFIHGL